MSSSNFDGDRRFNARSGYSVVVRNLSYELSETDVEEFFGRCGTILKVKLPLDRETDRKRGYAYIDFQNESAVAEALKLSGREIGGRPVTVLAHNRDSYDTNRSAASQSLPDYIGLSSPVHSTRALQFAETKRVEIDKDPDLWNYIPNISNPVWCGDILVPLAELERIKEPTIPKRFGIDKQSDLPQCYFSENSKDFVKWCSQEPRALCLIKPLGGSTAMQNFKDMMESYRERLLFVKTEKMLMYIIPLRSRTFKDLRIWIPEEIEENKMLGVILPDRDQRRSWA